jgi:hypothetical protein
MDIRIPVRGRSLRLGFEVFSSTLIMSDSEQDTVLGKRIRNGGDASHSEDINAEPVEEDDDDDEVGPMPMPVDGVVKKKRKGAS